MTDDLQRFEEHLFRKISHVASSEDPAHDLLHFQRVVRMTKKFCALEKANLNIALPAAWLHDLVIVPKNDPRRKQASRLSAEAAVRFLAEIDYPREYFDAIAHAIEAHSFSAGLETKTLEAKIVQDADRLDGLGAIGIARCFATAGLMKRVFYSDVDPFCEERPADDGAFTIDHFFVKLFKIAETMKTHAGQEEAHHRVSVMKRYLLDLQNEIVVEID